MKITLFAPCFVDALYPQVAIAVVRILETLGHTIDVAEDLNCCGQPAFNSGCWLEAHPVGERVLERLRDAETVLIPSGSCGAMLRCFYPELFAGTPCEAAARALTAKVFEFSEFLVDKLGVTDLAATRNGRWRRLAGPACRSLGAGRWPSTSAPKCPIGNSCSRFPNGCGSTSGSTAACWVSWAERPPAR